MRQADSSTEKLRAVINAAIAADRAATPQSVTRAVMRDYTGLVTEWVTSGYRGRSDQS
jgi:hypothetical protein